MKKTVVNLATGEVSIVDLTPEEVAQAEAMNEQWKREQEAYVPPKIPMWAFRTVLQNDGLFDSADSMIASSDDNALKNVWQYGNFAERTSPAIANFAQIMGLTDAQVDKIFKDANKLLV